MLYAIIASPDCSDLLTSRLSAIQGVEDSKLITVSCNKLTAIVAEISRKKVVVNTENALTFAKVIDKLSRHYPILPIRYGTLMDSDESIILLLEKYESKFEQNLCVVENKEEFSLKVFWDYEKESKKIRQQIYATEMENRTPFQGDSSSKAYLLQKMKEHRFENALLTSVEQLVGEICMLLTRFNPIYKFKKMVSQTMILDAVLLFDKEQKEVLIRAIDGLKNQHKNLRFLLTGPWPPYNFVELDIK